MYFVVTESQDSRASKDLSGYLVKPLILNLGKLRPRELRDLSKVTYMEQVNAMLSAPSTRPHVLMMMKKKIMQRIVRVGL